MNWQSLPVYAPRNRSKLLDSIEEPAFDLFRLFVLAHRIGVILHLYRPGSRSLFRFFSSNKYGRAYRWWTVMNHCCRVPRDRIRMIHRRFCTRCHVILPFSYSLPLYPSETGRSPGNMYADPKGLPVLALPLYASSRCHFMLQGTRRRHPPRKVNHPDPDR